MIVFVDPLLADTTGTPRTRLSGAREEARRIARADATLHVGAAATAERARSPETTAAAVLHFATHAEVTPWTPERSALLLAGNEGRLATAGIEGLRLSADLVTLSGCRTGGGYRMAGEGVIGLGRSFLIAGSRSVVMSLWEVEDRAAAVFMENFYGHLRDGVARDEALRRARLAMARRGAPHRDRSAFVISGAGQLPVESLSQSAKGGRPRGLPSMLLALLAMLALGALVVLGILGVLGDSVRRRHRGRGRPPANGV